MIRVDPTQYPNLPEAECKDQDPEIWFSFDGHAQAQAARICRRCPEIRNCLAWALTHDEYGIWAGTTEQQRTDLRERHQQGATA